MENREGNNINRDNIGYCEQNRLRRRIPQNTQDNPNVRLPCEIRERNRRIYEEKRRRKLKRRRRIFSVLLVCAAVPLLIFLTLAVRDIIISILKSPDSLARTDAPEWIDVQIIDIHDSARTGKRLKSVNNIVVHYVGNPASSAQGNHDYFAQEGTEVSSHFVIGLDGEIIQCIPLNEVSAASNHRNPDTISIEVCHPDESGQFTYSSYASLVKLCAWLCDNLSLDETDIIRHYDVTGKECPIYYVHHEDAWEQFKCDVGDELGKSD